VIGDKVVSRILSALTLGFAASALTKYLELTLTKLVYLKHFNSSHVSRRYVPDATSKGLRECEAVFLRTRLLRTKVLKNCLKPHRMSPHVLILSYILGLKLWLHRSEGRIGR
jgi:hypothetical protein